MPALSFQVRLALDALRSLAGAPSPLPVEPLASALAVPTDRLLAVLGPLQYAGWVRREPTDDDTVRYLRPVPPPTLQEVIEAIEGSAPIDDCVLNPGVPCGGLRSAPVCAGHRAWTDQLTASALTVGGLIGTGGLGRSMPASRGGHGAPNPLGSRRDDALPADARSADARPAAARPDDALPGDARSADARPAAARPADAQPAETRPAGAGLATARPADAQPADSPGSAFEPTADRVEAAVTGSGVARPAAETREAAPC